MIDIAIATCTQLPDLDADNALLIPALAERGLCARPVVWNDPSVDWSLPKVTVIRSTWDYHHLRLILETPAFMHGEERMLSADRIPIHIDNAPFL